MSDDQEHDAEAILDRILAAAVELLDASYGALLVGSAPAAGWRTVHQRFGSGDLTRLRTALESAGVPARLLSERAAIHIPDLAWAGVVPTGAPVQVLAVPFAADGAVRGGLLVAAAGHPAYSDHDARLLAALAETASIAIEAERRRAALLRREAWSDASAETVSSLLAGDLEQPLDVLAARVKALAQADAVLVLRVGSGPDLLRVVAAAGDDRGSVGAEASLRESLAGESMVARQPRRLARGVLALAGAPTRQADAGPVLVAPMISEDAAIGAVVARRHRGAPEFAAVDLDLLAGFVRHTTLALELAEVRADRDRVLLIEDRARIARDLHDTVIQQLFAAGLELRATAAEAGLPEVHAGVDQGVSIIDGAIAGIRTVVLALSDDPHGTSLRHRILDVVHDLSRGFEERVELRFDGPVELVAHGALGEDVVAVVREALTNVARHAGATRAGVQVAVIDGWIRVEVWDDGRGLPDWVDRSGLANLDDRAAHRGGEFRVARMNGRTRAVWSVPYGAGSPA